MCWWKVCSTRYHGISPPTFPSQVASLDRHGELSGMAYHWKRGHYKTNWLIPLSAKDLTISEMFVDSV